MKPAIVIGTHTMGLGVIRALGRMGVPIVALYYNEDDMGYVSRFVNKKMHIAHPEAQEPRFIQQLCDLARDYPDSPLFPVSDESLKIVSKNKAVLSRYFKVACAEWEIIKLLIEKDHTYALAASVGVPIPRTSTPASVEEVVEFSRGLDYPCLVKPVESHRYFAMFHRKMFKVFNFDELMSAYREAADAGLAVMLQELIPGDDSCGVNYNSYFWGGQPLLEFTAQKVRSAPPELGSPCVAYSQHIPEVLEYGRKVLQVMGFYGYSCSEFKRDPRDGVYKLMEVNGRHNLSTLLAVNSGINFPWLHYRHLTEGLVPPPTDFRDGLYWVDMERDLAFVPRRVFKKKEGLGQIFSPYLRPHVSAVFDFADPLPFFKRYADFGRKAVENVFYPSKSKTEESLT